MSRLRPMVRRSRWTSLATLVALGWLLLCAGAAHGDALVLIHGYQSNARTWFKNGVYRGLEQDGWHFGGELVATAEGPMLRGGKGEKVGQRAYYTLNLPYEAPLPYQERYLYPLVETLTKRHPGEHIILVGHSNGGVVARLLMVRHPDLGIYGLITIASPHLGTGKANLGRLVGSTPLTLMAPFLGAGTLNRSQYLYSDLEEAKPGTFLYWLNRQPHPPAFYASIVRKTSLFSLGDFVVPTFNSDLNNVAALRGRARTVLVEGDHGLQPEDGILIARLADEMLAAPAPPDVKQANKDQ